MKVLLLADSLTAGGKERRLVELMKGFQNHKDLELQLVIFSDKIHYKEVLDLGYTVHILKRSTKKDLRVIYRLFKLCKAWKPDIIHSWGTMSSLIAIPSCIILGKRLINGIIANAPPILPIYDKRRFRATLTFPFSYKIIGNSKAGLRAYRVPSKKGVCVYNGFDLKRVESLEKAEDVRERLGITEKFTVGMVAGFTPKKDWNTFIQSGLDLLSLTSDLCIVAVGDGPLLSQFKELIPQKYQSRFLFTGLQKDVESIINIFNIGVLTTNAEVHGEGISNAILEYMALSKPVIASYGGGTDEAIEHEKTGLLIPPNEPGILTERIKELLNHTSLCTEMGAKGRERLEKIFGLTRMNQEFYQIYKSAYHKSEA